MASVFISHRGADQDAAERLARDALSGAPRCIKWVWSRRGGLTGGRSFR